MPRRFSGWGARLGATVALGWLLLVAPARAQEPAGAQRVHFVSPAMGTERSYLVWLPPGYDPAAEVRYPVVYLLHGLQGAASDFFVRGRVAEHLERAIASGSLPPVIAVAPEGDDGYWTNHLDRPGGRGARYGDLVADDLVDAVDSAFKTKDDRQARVLVGVSMGGFGAASLALARRERFGAAASLSGALFPVAPNHREVYRRAWGDPPVERYFRRSSPIHLAARLPKRSDFPRLYLHSGDDDGLGFLGYTLRMHEILDSRGIAHELRVSQGGHSWSVWEAQTDDWLAFVASVLAPSTPKP